MFDYQTIILSNGLRVIAQQDNITPLAAVNMLYAVGSRDEDENKTGLAHLFEHLMFGGSSHVADFDKMVQNASGESNAYTTPDLTNYYITLPAQNIETAFWLESDRMFFPKLESCFEAQKKVVIEECKQRYLNQPYGDVWLKIRDLAYQVHPYRWATIGRSIQQIEQLSLADTQDFFLRFYHPSNAILSVVSPFEPRQIFEWAQKWFGYQTSPANSLSRVYPKEPQQNQQHRLYVAAKVPQKAVYIAFHCPAADSEDVFPLLVLNYIFSQGKSARLHQNLVKKQKTFVEASMSMTGSKDPGLVVASGRLANIDFQTGYQLIMQELYEAQNISESEVQKAKNQLITQIFFADLSPANRANRLAYCAFLGDLDRINYEKSKLMAVETSTVKELAAKLFHPDKASVLFYGEP